MNKLRSFIFIIGWSFATLWENINFLKVQIAYVCNVCERMFIWFNVYFKFICPEFFLSQSNDKWESVWQAKQQRDLNKCIDVLFSDAHLHSLQIISIFLLHYITYLGWLRLVIIRYHVEKAWQLFLLECYSIMLCMT